MTTYPEPLRQVDVLLAFMDEAEWLSRRQIAERMSKALDRQVKPHGRLFRLIDSLVDEGYIERTTYPLPNGVQMFLHRRIVPLEEA